MIEYTYNSRNSAEHPWIRNIVLSALECVWERIEDDRSLMQSWWMWWIVHGLYWRLLRCRMFGRGLVTVWDRVSIWFHAQEWKLKSEKCLVKTYLGICILSSLQKIKNQLFTAHIKRGSPKRLEVTMYITKRSNNTRQHPTPLCIHYHIYPPSSLTSTWKNVSIYSNIKLIDSIDLSYRAGSVTRNPWVIELAAVDCSRNSRLSPLAIADWVSPWELPLLGRFRGSDSALNRC